MSRPFSQACENNREPILAVLREHLSEPGELLEIGSGTGQHAAWLPRFLPHIRWRPSDVAGALPGIRLWREQAPDNTLEPLELDAFDTWPEGTWQYLFTANTFHILAMEGVERIIREGAKRLTPEGLFIVYGPFHHDGRPTSESNARFDAMLRERDPRSGIRDDREITALMKQAGLTRIADHPMPANNRTLVFGAPAGRGGV